MAEPISNLTVRGSRAQGPEWHTRQEVVSVPSRAVFKQKLEDHQREMLSKESFPVPEKESEMFSEAPPASSFPAFPIL